MFWHAGSYCKHVGIEDDVARIHPDFCGQDVVGASAYRCLALIGCSLPLFIECHHHCGGSEIFDDSGLADEFLFSMFQGNGVDYGSAGGVTECAGYRVEIGGIYHPWNACNLRICCQQSKEVTHLVARLKQAVVHVYIEDHRAVGNLFPGYGYGFAVVFLFYQAQEFAASGHVASFADVDESAVVGKFIKSGYPWPFSRHGTVGRAFAVDCGAQSCDMRRGSAAAAAGYIECTFAQ